MNNIIDFEKYIHENYNKLPEYFIPCFYTKTIFNQRIGISARYYKGKVQIIRKTMGIFEARKFIKRLKNKDYKYEKF